MAVTLRRSASYSTGSIARSNFQTSGWGMGLNGMASSSQSIRGHYGPNFDFSSSFSPSHEFSVFGSEKLAMQNLNSRLASYLEKVLSLETANLKLEQKIDKFNESRTPASRDLSKYYSIIEDLQKQIISMAKQKQEVYTKLDNANITASEFKMKFENERDMCLSVEADLTRLRMALGETEMETKDLQIQMSWLKEELIFLKKSHEEDLHMARTQQNGSVNVEVDSAPAVDLNNKLEEIREQYEAVIIKNRNEIEQWFQNKVKNLNTEVLKSHTEITTSQTAFSDLKKTYETLEIDIKGIHTQIQMLQNDLVQVGARYSEQLSQLQLYIDRIQTELQQITANIQQQAMEYQLLLDIKMRLELEIAEYRRLLEGEGQGYRIDTSTVTKKVTETVVEETQETQKTQEEKHHHQRRVKVIVEELVDGVIVSSSVDEKVQDLPN
ncbi:keratin, type I cytoskeletal 13-like [Ictalurus furcatus]|uniref:keratin, type I cytoskeletal 13-like n=1 Tax=Ictalurus furcatus TaxID=66913 RepID=UPI0023509400|nr:keratin, type I cytoskeletal 13-like [Ictalurus furcatus]